MVSVHSCSSLTSSVYSHHVGSIAILSLYDIYTMFPPNWCVLGFRLSSMRQVKWNFRFWMLFKSSSPPSLRSWTFCPSVDICQDGWPCYGLLSQSNHRKQPKSREYPIHHVNCPSSHHPGKTPIQCLLLIHDFSPSRIQCHPVGGCSIIPVSSGTAMSGVVSQESSLLLRVSRIKASGRVEPQWRHACLVICIHQERSCLGTWRLCPSRISVHTYITGPIPDNTNSTISMPWTIRMTKIQERCSLGSGVYR